MDRFLDRYGLILGLIVVCAILALAFLLGGCFSSPAPSQVPQLPQPPPIIVDRAIPVPVPEVLVELARRLAAIPDNHPAADLAHQAATGIKVYAQTADCVSQPPTVIQLAPVVNPTAPVANPTTPKPKLSQQFSTQVIICFTLGVLCAAAAAVAFILAKRGLPFAKTAGGCLLAGTAACFVGAFLFWQVEAVLWVVGVVAGLALIAAGLNWIVHRNQVAPKPGAV